MIEAYYANLEQQMMAILMRRGPMKLTALAALMRHNANVGKLREVLAESDKFVLYEFRHVGQNGREYSRRLIRLASQPQVEADMPGKPMASLPEVRNAVFSRLENYDFLA